MNTDESGRSGSVDGSLPWTDEDQFRDLLARAWIYTPKEVDWGSFPERKHLKELLPLAGPIAALQLYGTPLEFERRQDAVREALAFAPMPWHRGDDYDRVKVERDAVLGFVGSLRTFAVRAKEAEAFLEEEQLKFHPDTRRVVRRQTGRNPFTFRRRVNVALSKALRAGRLENDKALREEIASILRWWFCLEDCSPEKDGPIDSDLKNAIASLRP